MNQDRMNGIFRMKIMRRRKAPAVAIKRIIPPSRPDEFFD
jgi:hypothetical protein